MGVFGGVVEKAFSTCPHDCPSTCALEVERIDAHTIGRIHGAKDQRYTAGIVCAKVARYSERVHHPDRLAHPLRRIGPKGSGQFERISWDAALDAVAEAFVKATQRHGSESVWPYYYAGTMGKVQRDGINRLRHVMRYSRMKKTICTGTADPGWKAGIGAYVGGSPYEISEADLIIVWGTNAVSTQVNVMTHIARARKERKAKLIVIDPYRNGTAEQADVHLCLKPGTDGALACAVMHVLFRDGFADRAWMAQHTDVPAQMEEHLKTRTPEWAAVITGLSVAEIEALAGDYARTQRAFIRVGFGLSRQRNGAANMHAITCLPSVSGKWQHRGAGAFFLNSAIYGLNQTLIEGLDVLDPTTRVLDMSRIGPVLTGDRLDLGDGPPVTAMITQNTNPADVAPDSNLVHRGLARDDLFLCVHEQMPTETVRFADIVLPATTFLEHDDLYTGAGHTYLQLGPKVIEPFAEARSNHEVMQCLAKRLGATHPGFDMTAAELIDATLKASGHPDFATLRAKKWHDCEPPFAQAHFLDGFPTPDRKFHFSPDWAAQGPLYAAMPVLPDHQAVIETTDDEHPFRMVTAPSRSFLNSTFNNTPSSVAREKRPTVLLHPASAAKLAIADGSDVKIGNRRGAVTVMAKLFDGVQPDVVVVEGVWPGSAFPEGMGINALTGADSPPPNGGAAFHDNAVWIRPALSAAAE